ncbi:MAG: hypothetical protein GX825_01295 [Syntrophomonadaceae bacterium]|nr:hypothetical protein [Syntrophomonadaceae bacterium]
MDYQRAVRLLRHQRHDFANYLQVIKGYLEIDMPQRALEYLNSTSLELQEMSRWFNSLPEEASVLLMEMQIWAHSQGLVLTVGKIQIDANNKSVSETIMAAWKVLQELGQPDPLPEEEFEVCLNLITSSDGNVCIIELPDALGQGRSEIVIKR